MTQPIRLWLDDIRDPTMYGCFGWKWVKTYEEAIDALAQGNVIEASLDHDLSIQAAIGQLPANEKTGYDVVCWMEEHNVWPPEGTAVHSANPAGAARMRQVINLHR